MVNSIMTRISQILFGKEKKTKDLKEEHMCAVKRFVVNTQAGSVDVYVNRGWQPLSDHLYVHDICIHEKGSLGRIYDAEVLAEVLEEVHKEVTKDFPNIKGVSISEHRFNTMPAFWITHGFEDEGTFVPSSGIVYSWTW